MSMEPAQSSYEEKCKSAFDGLLQVVKSDHVEHHYTHTKSITKIDPFEIHSAILELNMKPDDLEVYDTRTEPPTIYKINPNGITKNKGMNGITKNKGMRKQGEGEGIFKEFQPILESILRSL